MRPSGGMGVVWVLAYLALVLLGPGVHAGGARLPLRAVVPVVRGARGAEGSRERALRHGHVQVGQSRWHFFQCALAGAISCSTTHGLMVPLDVIKTKLQTEASMSSMSIGAAYERIVKEGGTRALLKGFSAVYAGYFFQGMCKFGFYEYFKSRICSALDAANYGLAANPGLKLPAYIASSGLAEIIASFALTPLEVTKIDMMSNPLSKDKNVFEAMSLIVRTGGLHSLFRGLPLIMLRQVPYTCVKLAGYDLIVEALRKRAARARQAAAASAAAAAAGAAGATGQKRLSAQEKDAERSRIARGDVYLQLLSGILAGVISATLSHPADVMLSKVCGGTAALTECIIVQGPRDILLLMRELGVKGCFKGLKTRALMTAVITAAQFGIYERAKQQIVDVTFDSRLDPKKSKK